MKIIPLSQGVFGQLLIGTLFFCPPVYPSPDSVPADQALQIWQLESSAGIPEHLAIDVASGFAVTRQGQQFITADESGAGLIILQRNSSGLSGVLELSQFLPLATAAIRGITISQDGQKLALADFSQGRVITARCRSREQGQCIWQKVSEHLLSGTGPHALAFDANSQWLFVIGLFNDHLNLFKYQQDQLSVIKTIDLHSALPEDSIESAPEPPNRQLSRIKALNTETGAVISSSAFGGFFVIRILVDDPLNYQLEFVKTPVLRPTVTNPELSGISVSPDDQQILVVSPALDGLLIFIRSDNNWNLKTWFNQSRIDTTNSSPFDGARDIQMISGVEGSQYVMLAAVNSNTLSVFVYFPDIGDWQYLQTLNKNDLGKVSGIGGLAVAQQANLFVLLSSAGEWRMIEGWYRPIFNQSEYEFVLNNFNASNLPLVLGRVPVSGNEARDSGSEADVSMTRLAGGSFANIRFQLDDQNQLTFDLTEDSEYYMYSNLSEMMWEMTAVAKNERNLTTLVNITVLNNLTQSDRTIETDRNELWSIASLLGPVGVIAGTVIAVGYKLIKMFSMKERAVDVERQENEPEQEDNKPQEDTQEDTQEERSSQQAPPTLFSQLPSDSAKSTVDISMLDTFTDGVALKKATAEAEFLSLTDSFVEGIVNSQQLVLDSAQSEDEQEQKACRESGENNPVSPSPRAEGISPQGSRLGRFSCEATTQRLRASRRHFQPENVDERRKAKEEEDIKRSMDEAKKREEYTRKVREERFNEDN